MDMEQELWPGWKTVKLIGMGSFGKVYEIRRENIGGFVEKAALKVIAIPQSAEDIQSLYEDGLDHESITRRFADYLADIVKEYNLMLEMKGHGNIVICDDLRYIQHKDGMGWDIFIRMELLTPLLQVLPKDVPEEQVIEIAIDICKALVCCQQKHVLHRDIKPQNIFVSDDGEYKLGDFGIAKVAERTTSGTKTGTYRYMAPEIYNNQPYGGGVDIYSLGMVMYWMLNKRRMPFLPLPPETYTANQEEESRYLRMEGRELPPPCSGSDKLRQLVLKACAFSPEDRFSSAAEMLEALNSIQKKRSARVRKISDMEDIQDDRTAVMPADWFATGLKEVPPGDGDVEKIRTAAEYLRVKKARKAAEMRKAEGARRRAESRRVAAEVRAGAAYSKQARKRACRRIKCLLLVLAMYVLLLEEFKPSLQPEQAEAVDMMVEPYYPGSSPWKDITEPWEDITKISVGNKHIMGLNWDGSVYADSPWEDETGCCDVEDWRNITDIAAGNGFSVGLKADGTAVSAGAYTSTVLVDVTEWDNLSSICARDGHAVGVKNDGTVVASGTNYYGQCNVENWTDIIAADAGEDYTVGLKSDHTVVCTDDRYPLSGWQDIQSIHAGGRFIIGLKSDGTVLASYYDDWGAVEVRGWTDIVKVSTSYYGVAGVKSDGTVVTDGISVVNNGTSADLNWRRHPVLNNDSVSSWTNIVDVAVADNGIAGLRADGSVVAAHRITDEDGTMCAENFKPVQRWRNIGGIYVTGFGVIGVGRS